MNEKIIMLLFLFLLMAGSAAGSNILFEERFEDSSLSSRGWYDNTSPILTDAEHIPGSTKSIEFHFPQGATKPVNGALMRKMFQETESVYIRYHVKYSANWTGSNVSYHPHEFYLLTNMDSAWTGPAYTRLTAYIEQNAGKPQIGIQDSVNIDLTNIGKDLIGVSEARGVAGCNGDSDGYGSGDCYASGGSYRNGKMWQHSKTLFSTSAPYNKNNWHRIEVFLQLNSIVDGKSRNDGIIQYWFDGNLVMDFNNVVFRTATNPNMKFNQFLIGPYIGVGSPIDQSFWVDDLVLTDSITNQPKPPQNLRIIEQN
jgi:hypothetical protein